MSTFPTNVTSGYDDVIRRSANYKPNQWDYTSVQSINNNYTEENYGALARDLREQVCAMFNVLEPLAQVKLIDTIDHQGLGYHFEEEIKIMLNDMIARGYTNVVQTDGLHATSVLFRLLRSHGFMFSEDIFKPFMNDENNFKESLSHDVEGLISLYQASHLSFKGESILDAAKSFSETHLKRFTKSKFAEEIAYAMDVPSHWRPQRLEARRYIDIYDKEADNKSVLLQFAKLDFNMVQSIHQSELTKITKWEINELENLPNYMKMLFKAISTIVDETACDIQKHNGLNILPFLRKAWADLCKAFLVEANWQNGKNTPTLAEYINNGWVSVSGPLILTHVLFLLRQVPTKEVLDHLESSPKIIRLASTIFRLCNDLATSIAEQERGDAPTGIQCYMKDTGVSEAKAREHISSVISETWKELNKEYMLCSSFPQPFVEACVNLARMAICIYQHRDGFGIPSFEIKGYIQYLLIKPIDFIGKDIAYPNTKDNV